MIHPLLTPLDPDQNPHKQKQLRELVVEKRGAMEGADEATKKEAELMKS